MKNVLFLVLLLAGCSTLPPIECPTEPTGSAESVQDAALDAITATMDSLTEATEDECLSVSDAHVALFNGLSELAKLKPDAGGEIFATLHAFEGGIRSTLKLAGEWDRCLVDADDTIALAMVRVGLAFGNGLDAALEDGAFTWGEARVCLVAGLAAIGQETEGLPSWYGTAVAAVSEVAGAALDFAGLTDRPLFCVHPLPDPLPLRSVTDRYLL